jgi:menaquinone-dependent protoporphyrinogen oxidase
MNASPQPSARGRSERPNGPLVLIVYASTEGQSQKIAEYAGAVATTRGWRAELQDVRSIVANGAPDGADALLVAASVHVGRHSELLREFVQNEQALLAAVPTTFLSVSLHAVDEESLPIARGYLDEFLEETGWQPTFSGTVAGALPYSGYGFFKRMLMKQIARRGGLPADTSRDYEFTDWDEVRRQTENLLEHARERRLAFEQPVRQPGDRTRGRGSAGRG